MTERYRHIRSFSLDEVVAFAKSQGVQENETRLIPPRIDHGGHVICTLG